MARRVERIDGRHHGLVCDRQPLAGHALVEEPDPARDRPGRRVADEGRDDSRTHGVEHPLENERVESFMAKGEADMVCDAVTRPVALVEDGPAVLGAVTALDVSAGNGACRPDRGGDAEAVNQRGPAGQPRSEEHTSELQSLMRISYAVFCLKKKKTT